MNVLQECWATTSDCLPWLCTCLAVWGITSWPQGSKFQTGDTTSTECLAWSNSVWKPKRRGRWALPSTGRERSPGMFSTSTMLKVTRLVRALSLTGEFHLFYTSKSDYMCWELNCTCLKCCLKPFVATEGSDYLPHLMSLESCSVGAEDHKIENDKNLRVRG